MAEFLDAYRGDGPLRDVTIVDFSQMMMGPLATQLLGDLGGLVIKVERPVVGEWERSFLPRGRTVHGESPYFLAMNRNKLSFAADLKNAEDREHVLALVERCDAVVHNYRPGVMERLGLGFHDLLERNPRLVYAQGSGYGPDGPLVSRPGQDLLIQAMSGLAANSGPATGPPVPLATAVCDAAAGFLLAFSTVSAILDARNTGTPRRVDVSLLGTALLMQCQEAFVALNTDMTWQRSSSGIAAPWNDAPYGIYATSDGWIAVAMTPRAKLVDLLRPPREPTGKKPAGGELAPEELVALDDEAWYERREEINTRLAQRLASADTATWVEDLADRDVWAAPVLTLEEILEHPQVQANGFVEAITLAGAQQQVRAVGGVARFTGTSGEASSVDRLPPPGVGEHTAMVVQALRDLENDPVSTDP